MLLASLAETQNLSTIEQNRKSVMIQECCHRKGPWFSLEENVVLSAVELVQWAKKCWNETSDAPQKTEWTGGAQSPPACELDLELPYL